MELDRLINDNADENTSWEGRGYFFIIHIIIINTNLHKLEINGTSAVENTEEEERDRSALEKPMTMTEPEIVPLVLKARNDDNGQKFPGPREVKMAAERGEKDKNADNDIECLELPEENKQDMKLEAAEQEETKSNEEEEQESEIEEEEKCIVNNNMTVEPEKENNTMVVEDDEGTKVYNEEEMELNDSDNNSDNIPGLMKEDSV